MLSSPDIDLVERQPELPGLSMILDSDRIAESAKARGMMMTPDCEVSYIRFKPGTSCMVGYRPRGSLAPPIFYATALAPGSAKLIKAGERRLWPTPYGAGRLIIADACVEICAFPNDNHLKGIGELASEDASRRAIESLFGPRFQDSSVTLDHVAYKPERRCVFRLSADGKPVAALKVYVRQSFQGALARASTLDNLSNVHVPAVIASRERRSIVALEWIPGPTLDEILEGVDPDMRSVFAAGAALARFHRSRVEGLNRVTTAQTLSHLHAIVTALRVIHPALFPVASAALEHLAVELIESDGDDVTIHGDFYAKQLIAAGDRITFIDTDECAIGPRVSDLGNFLAHLEVAVNQGQLVRSAADAATDAFLDGYRSEGPDVDDRQLELWTAVGLLKVLHEPFRHHRPGWPAEMSRLAQKSSELIAPAECARP